MNYKIPSTVKNDDVVAKFKINNHVFCFKYSTANELTFSVHYKL